MRSFHTTTYNLYNKNDIKLCIMSDIHFSKYLKNKKLNRIIKYIDKIKVDYILIPGDLIDSVNDIENINEKERILNWINKLSKISKVIISIGNHDFYYKIDKNKKDYNDNKEFFNEINKIDNVYLLDNQVYQDDNVYITGFTISFPFYHEDNINLLINDLDNNKKILEPENDKLKLLMIHSPESLDEKEIFDKINKFDFIITGHMHNGCVPPIINEIWKSSTGIINPSKKFFTKNTRNTLNKKEDKILINGPVTTFSKLSGIFRIFNFLYPTYITIMKFSNKHDFEIIRKYHSK